MSERDVPLTTHTLKETELTLADVLLEVGVLLMSPGKRTELANALQVDGIQIDDVRLLATYLAQMMPEDPAKAKRILAAKLLSGEDRKQVIEDLRRHRALAAAQAAPTRTTTHYWGFPSPHPSCACEGCEGRRRMGYAEVRS